MKTKTNIKAGIVRADLHPNCRGIKNQAQCEACCATVHPTWTPAACWDACND